jgi:hypothetical protein
MKWLRGCTADHLVVVLKKIKIIKTKQKVFGTKNVCFKKYGLTISPKIPMKEHI